MTRPEQISIIRLNPALNGRPQLPLISEYTTESRLGFVRRQISVNRDMPHLRTRSIKVGYPSFSKVVRGFETTEQAHFRTSNLLRDDANFWEPEETQFSRSSTFPHNGVVLSLVSLCMQVDIFCAPERSRF